MSNKKPRNLPKDITRCAGTRCPIKDDCLRFTKPLPPIEDATTYSHFMTTPYNHGLKRCDFFIACPASLDLAPSIESFGTPHCSLSPDIPRSHTSEPE